MRWLVWPTAFVLVSLALAGCSDARAFDEDCPNPPERCYEALRRQILQDGGVIEEAEGAVAELSAVLFGENLGSSAGAVIVKLERIKPGPMNATLSVSSAQRVGWVQQSVEVPLIGAGPWYIPFLYISENNRDVVDATATLHDGRTATVQVANPYR